MPKNLTYDNRNACCVPYDSPPPGFEHNCRERGCAVLRKISHIVAVIRPGGDESETD